MSFENKEEDAQQYGTNKQYHSMQMVIELESFDSIATATPEKLLKFRKYFRPFIFMWQAMLSSVMMAFNKR